MSKDERAPRSEACAVRNSSADRRHSSRSIVRNSRSEKSRPVEADIAELISEVCLSQKADPSTRTSLTRLFRA